VVAKGALARFNGVVISGAQNGLLAVDNALAEVSGSTIRDNTTGVSATRSAAISVDSTVIENNTYDVISASQAVVLLTNSSPEATPSSGVIVSQTAGVGVFARFGGQVILVGAHVQGAGFGLYVHSGGILQLSGANLISGNQVGIEGRADTTVGVNGGSNDVQGNLVGVRCSGDTNYFLEQGAVLAVQGNSFIDNNGCLL